MAFIKIGDREGCFRPEAVTHFTIHSILEKLSNGGQQYVTFIKAFAGNFQIAQYLWQGNTELTYEIVGSAIKRAERSGDDVVTFDSLIEIELGSVKLSAVA